MINFRKIYSDLLALLDPYDKQSPNRLSLTVVPVAIVEDLSAAPISPTTLGSGWFTEGFLTNKAADFLLADTGALPSGVYEITVYGYNVGAFAKQFLRVQHRDAANGATLHEQRFTIASDVTTYTAESDIPSPLVFPIFLLSNERIRLLQGFATAAGVSVQASIWIKKL